MIHVQDSEHIESKTGRKRRPYRKWLSSGAASTVVLWGMYRYVDPSLFEETSSPEPSAEGLIPRPRSSARPE